VTRLADFLAVARGRVNGRISRCANRVGDWTLRHPVGVLGAFATLGGAVLGAKSGGLTGACVGAVAALVLSAFIASIEPIDPALGPHQ